MRGPDDLVHLTTSELLKGAPVFSPSGERLGTLTGAVVYRPSGSIASVELERSWMFGLLRQHLTLPREILTGPNANGGFVVPWPLPDASTRARSSVTSGALRLDPARDE